MSWLARRVHPSEEHLQYRKAPSLRSRGDRTQAREELGSPEEGVIPAPETRVDRKEELPEKPIVRLRGSHSGLGMAY